MRFCFATHLVAVVCANPRLCVQAETAPTSQEVRKVGMKKKILAVSPDLPSFHLTLIIQLAPKVC